VSSAWSFDERAPALAASFASRRDRAREVAARAGSKRVELPHLVRALLDDAAVKRALEACGAEPEEVAAVVEGTADELPRKRWWHLGAPWESRALLEVYERALIHAFSAQLDAVTPLRLFVRALASHPTSVLAGRLDALEIDALRLMRFEAHGRVDDPPFPSGRGPARVILHDDPYTTMEAVVELLETWLDLDRAEAERVMRRVHGGGPVGVRFDTWEEARSKAEAARENARMRGFPLELSLEPAD
jgi:ATP-dependent Clp protease adapter protein ClpS